MIDLATETLLTLEDAAERLLVSNCPVTRWVTRGSKGAKLEALRVGGLWRTSVEALQRFADASTPAQQSDPAPAGTPHGATASTGDRTGRTRTR